MQVDISGIYMCIKVSPQYPDDIIKLAFELALFPHIFLLISDTFNASSKPVNVLFLLFYRRP